jgi:hypothetical protein
MRFAIKAAFSAIKACLQCNEQLSVCDVADDLAGFLSCIELLLEASHVAVLQDAVVCVHRGKQIADLLMLLPNAIPLTDQLEDLVSGEKIDSDVNVSAFLYVDRFGGDVGSPDKDSDFGVLVPIVDGFFTILRICCCGQMSTSDLNRDLFDCYRLVRLNLDLVAFDERMLGEELANHLYFQRGAGEALHSL